MIGFVKELLKRKSFLYGTIALLTLLFAGIFFFKSNTTQTPDTDIKTVEALKVSLGTIERSIQLIGILSPHRQIHFVAQSSGILYPLISPGTKVTKGTLIARIHNKSIEERQKLCQEAVIVGKNQYERIQKLSNLGQASKEALEDKKQKWIDAQKELTTVEETLEKLTFTAPFDGIVGVFKVREGEQVSEDDPIVTLYNSSRLIVDFDIPESYGRKIKEGCPLTIEGKSFTLTHIQKVIDPDTQMFPAYAEISDIEYSLGSPIAVDLITEQKHNTLVVPTDSVFLREGKSCVYKIKDLKAILTPVELGIRSKETIEILNGLTEGDIIVSKGQALLNPDASVKIGNDVQ